MAAGLSQEEMGARLGITGGGYGHWEGGRARPSLYELFRVASILGLDVVDLLVDHAPREGIVAESRVAYLQRIDPELAQLIAEVATLPPDELDLAKQAIKLALANARLRATRREIASYGEQEPAPRE